MNGAWTAAQLMGGLLYFPFELNYVESDGSGGYRNAARPFRASMGVMTAFNRVGPP